MADLPQQQDTSSPHWWVKLCRWLWSQRGFVWGTVFLGIALNLFATWLMTPQGSTFSNTPLGTILGHWQLFVLVGVGLLILTGIVGLVSWHNTAATNHNVFTPALMSRNRQTLIHALREEYTQRITHSLQGAAMITLELQERTDVTYSPAQLVFQRMDGGSEHLLAPGTSILQAYDKAPLGLLILGAPGAGKTMLILDLARELLNRAKEDPDHPIPVILNLSSWAVKKSLLPDWLVDQLQLVYQVPHQLGKQWLLSDSLLFLLDGLDEVQESAQAPCINAINAFHKEHFVPLVVCSRSSEYFAQPERFAFSRAITIQPLAQGQVTEYLKQMGKSTASARTILQNSPTVYKLMTTPLMLSLIARTYRGKRVKDLPQMGSFQEQQDRILATCVHHMLEQRGGISQYSYDKTIHWLGWLAQQMKRQSQTEFYIERMQPSLLLDDHSRRIYHMVAIKILSGLHNGFIFGMIFAATAGLWAFYFMGTQAAFYASIIGGLSGGILFLGLGLIKGLYTTLEIHPEEIITWVLIKRRVSLIRSLVEGLLVGITITLILSLIVFISILTKKPVNVENFIGFYIPIILLVSVIFSLLFSRWNVELSRKMFSNNQLKKPNQGIRRSAQNCIILGSTSGFLIGIAAGYFGGLPCALVFGFGFGISIAFSNGAGSCIQHWTLRWLLWRTNCISWHYAEFLNYATERNLLQRVGGGYCFVHPLFQKYFASLPIPEPENGT